MAVASSRCFLADTAEMRDGTILYKDGKPYPAKPKKKADSEEE